jgi:uncharacterized membrane protein YoaK (UPF0700 family)
MSETKPATNELEFIICLTTFAVGAVDIISFSRLGGVFASAMTGNLALLGLYSARADISGVLGTLTALSCFICGAALGNLLARPRDQAGALRVLLGMECALMLVALTLWFTIPHQHSHAGTDILVAVLACAMGIQSIVGKRLNLSGIPTVVFTSTLTNIVITLSDMLATRSTTLPADTRRQIATFVIYLAGAVCAGIATTQHAAILIFLPVAGVAAAFAAAIRARVGASS